MLDDYRQSAQKNIERYFIRLFGQRNTVVIFIFVVIFSSFLLVWNALNISALIQSYRNQRASFDASVEMAAKKFEQFDSNISQAIKDVHDSATRLSFFLDQSAFLLFRFATETNNTYLNYKAHYRNWLDISSKYASQFEKETNCRSDHQHFDFLIGGIVESDALRIHFSGLDLVTSKEKLRQLDDKYRSYGKCATSYLRDSAGGQYHAQVHGRAMNAAIMYYFESDYAICHYEMEKNKYLYINSCFTKQSVRDIQKCTSNVLKAVDGRVVFGIYGKPIPFDEFKNELESFHFYQFIFRQVLVVNRYEYVVRKCEESLGAWGRRLGWDCSARVKLHFSTEGYWVPE